MTKLGQLTAIRGNKTSLFNAGESQTLQLTSNDFALLRDVDGEVRETGRWFAVVDGWAYVVAVEEAEELEQAAAECAAVRDHAIKAAMAKGITFDDAEALFTESLAAKNVADSFPVEWAALQAQWAANKDSHLHGSGIQSPAAAIATISSSNLVPLSTEAC